MDQTRTKTSTPDPDLPLVKSALQGDFASFEQLVGRYEHRIYALALRIVRQDSDAQDVVQQTLLALVEKLDQFQYRSSFASWLLRIATNEALLVLRKRKHFPVAELDDSSPLAHPDFIAPWKGDPLHSAVNTEIRELIDQALDDLDEKYRLVFLLRDIQELSIEETAQALEITPANVKVRLLRARLMLREKLTRVLGDPASAIRHVHHA